jgi:hypothetical protein
MNSSRNKNSSPPAVVVAGDVCIDWLSIPVAPVASVARELGSSPLNWELMGGRHMYARRGGAWLTADFVAAAGNAARVSKPKGQPRLTSVPPEKIIHSMLMLDRRERERDHQKVLVWAVSAFEGYAGPPPGMRPTTMPVENDNARARIVVLDDAGNGFRDDEKAWPAALDRSREPTIIYKVRRPLREGKLWKQLHAFHLSRTIVVLSADELRGEGASVSRQLSWERSATDLVLSLARDPQLGGLRNCPFLVVPLGIEGAVLVRCEQGEVVDSRLWYEPSLTEGGLLGTLGGDMSGFGSAFCAAITAALVEAGCPSPSNSEAAGRALGTGICNGLQVLRRLLDRAFGPCERNKKRRPPDYPLKEIFERSARDSSPACEVSLPALPASRGAKKLDEYRAWRILESKREKAFAQLAAEVIRYGANNVFKQVPVGIFGGLTTVDRSEIESYRSISNLIREFLKKPNPERPLCLAVFGPPGGGKSFGVTQVALSVATKGLIEKLDFNVSQWDRPEYLVSALHRVRDHALSGKVPLVFFDEFDSQLGEQKLGWLRYFLAPMQDGVFADGLATHRIGKAIFVFAGGTASTFAEFRKKAGDTIEGAGSSNPESSKGEISARVDSENKRTTKPEVVGEDADSKSAKRPDFLSRLRGHVDVFGLDPPVGTNLLRRALVLRSNILKKYPSLRDASDAIRIDEGVLRGFLYVPRYEHGARSLEAILDMSNLEGRSHFDASLLPPKQQLNLHADGEAFIALVQHRQTLGDKLEDIAKEIHELYLTEELSKGARIGDRPSLYHWEELDEIYKNSSREQAANYPALLAAVECEFEEGGQETKQESSRRRAVGRKRPASSSGTQAPQFMFSRAEIDRLARMEHVRWMEERRIKQPDHADLEPWEKLSAKEKEKDIRAIKAMPEILEKVGLRIVRLS